MRPAFAALVTATLSFQSVEAQETNLQPNHPYAGMWVTDDNRVHHELLPNGRYVEARGQRERAYEGRYEVDGTHNFPHCLISNCQSYITNLADLHSRMEDKEITCQRHGS